MTDKPGLPGPDEELDLDAIIKADEEDKKKEDALLSSAKKKDVNRKRLFVGVLSLALVAVVTSLFVFKPFGLGGGNGEDKKEPDGTSTTAPATPTQDPNKVGEPGEKLFWEEDGKQYPVQTPLAPWQLQSSDSYLQAGNDPKADAEAKTEEEKKAREAERQAAVQKAKEELEALVGNYNITIPGVASNLQTLPSTSNGFTDDASKATLPDGTLNPQYSYWTLEGFNNTVNYTLQRFVNPVFGGWTLYQYPSAKGALDNPQRIVSQFGGVYDPKYLESVKDKSPSTWLPIFADWNSDDYGMGNQLLSDGPRWMGTLDSVETTFKFDENTGQYTAHVKANVTYVAWSQSQSTLKKTGVIEFDVLPGDNKDSRYMLSNSKLEMTA